MRNHTLWYPVVKERIWILYITAKYPHGHHLHSSRYTAQSDRMGTYLKWEGKITKKEGKIQSYICSAGLKRQKWLKEPRAKVWCQGQGNESSSLSLSAFHMELELLKCRTVMELCHHQYCLGKQGDSGPYIPLLRLSQTSWYIFSNQLHQLIYCRMEIFLSPITLLSPFYLFRAKGLWDKDLFLLHMATWSLRVAYLSNSGLSSATGNNITWNKLCPKKL